jgi:internalin A
LLSPSDKLLATEDQGIDAFYEFSEGNVFEISVDELLNGVDLDRIKTLKSVTPAKMRRIRLFYSYSHKDERLRDDLETHLKILERLGLVESWHDRRINPGDEFARSIDDNLRRADIVLLLVSANFIASDYCWEKEMTLALERHAEGQTVVIPIILHACNWKKAPFGRLNALPQDGRPISQWRPKANAWENISAQIQRVIENLQTK